MFTLYSSIYLARSQNVIIVWPKCNHIGWGTRCHTQFELLSHFIHLISSSRNTIFHCVYAIIGTHCDFIICASDIFGCWRFVLFCLPWVGFFVQFGSKMRSIPSIIFVYGLNNVIWFYSFLADPSNIIINQPPWYIQNT